MTIVDKAFFMRRLNDHIQYLKQIDAAVNGKSDFQGTTYRDCQLGQWLYNEASTVITNMKSTQAKEVYESLLEPHKQFHLLGEEALQKKQAGDEVGAKAALTQLHLLSNLLTKKLLELDSLN